MKVLNFRSYNHNLNRITNSNKEGDGRPRRRGLEALVIVLHCIVFIRINLHESWFNYNQTWRSEIGGWYCFINIIFEFFCIFLRVFFLAETISAKCHLQQFYSSFSQEKTNAKIDKRTWKIRSILQKKPFIHL